MTGLRPLAEIIAGYADRLADVIEVLGCSVRAGDMLTARYAAATITELGDRIESDLLAADDTGKPARAATTLAVSDA